MSSATGRWLWLLIVVALAGCQSWTQPRASGKVLSPLRMPTDSVVLEVFFVKLPHEDLASYDSIWGEVDEQILQNSENPSASVLAENGFRVGIAANRLPTRLQELLDQRGQLSNPAPRSKPDAPDRTGSLADATLEGMVVDVAVDPMVTIRQLPLQAGKRAEIISSGVHAEVPLLLRENGEVHGRSIRKFQGEFAIECRPLPDGATRLQMTPEIHHGDPRNQFSGENGVWTLETGRARKVLDQLAVAAALAPGDMLVLSSVRDRPGSLGHYFFAEDAKGRLNRKYLFIRIAHAQEPDLFEQLDD